MEDNRTKVAVVGVGRIGVFHARHVLELERAARPCRLTAVVDRHEDTAERVAAHLGDGTPIASFTTVDALLAAGAADAAIVATRTEDHESDARELIENGLRVLLEKPLADSLERTRRLADDLDRDPNRQHSLMLAFQRRYDEPLQAAKALVDAGAVGRPFKIVSALEDPEPPPDGYCSPGLIPDMAVHNIDEVLWLLGDAPTRTQAFAANLHNHFVSTVDEDFDDAFLQLSFAENRLAQITVSRNHVAAYRNETTIYGNQGMVHVGRVRERGTPVELEALDRQGRLIEHRDFEPRDYGKTVPVFIARFGDAYKAEVADFVNRCQSGAPFAVDQNDGLRAMEIAAAAQTFVQQADSLPRRTDD